MNWKSILLIGVVLLFLWKQFGPADDVSEVDLSTAVIIDVRTPNEFANGHVKGAINLPVDDLTESAIGNIAPKDQPLILYCKSGGRSASATNTLRRWGYQDVYHGYGEMQSYQGESWGGPRGIGEWMVQKISQKNVKISRKF